MFPNSYIILNAFRACFILLIIGIFISKFDEKDYNRSEVFRLLMVLLTDLRDYFGNHYFRLAFNAHIAGCLLNQDHGTPPEFDVAKHEDEIIRQTESTMLKEFFRIMNSMESISDPVTVMNCLISCSNAYRASDRYLDAYYA